MPDAASLRDSTQIVLPWETFEGLRDEVEEHFTVTVVDDGPNARIVGSPVEIKGVNDFLTRYGITVA
ncbi:hypothetical protein [Halosegnis marinus]|uniref:Uncharacterized protein n=1 Tax=Halosegnis marinus TaxID=3034023 RepID=A0ABD5ZS34_9EURY|nr:hypothetical protein [Halosegnis sp. DT85]